MSLRALEDWSKSKQTQKETNRKEQAILIGSNSVSSFLLLRHFHVQGIVLPDFWENSIDREAEMSNHLEALKMETDWAKNSTFGR